MFHYFSTDITNHKLPDLFTCPFHYTPHPLCIIAKEELCVYLDSQLQWHEELAQGKMFGVLVVKNKQGELGYLCAYSGNLAKNNKHPFFVPPVYDLLDKSGYFYEEELNISKINSQIADIQEGALWINLQHQLEEKQELAFQQLTCAKNEIKEAKEKRKREREHGISQERELLLIKESQFLKAEAKRNEKRWINEIDEIKTEIDKLSNIVNQLKIERRTRSASLQTWLFNQYQVCNADGEVISILDLFAKKTQRIPPAGTGECAAPKLLQFAYLNQLQPIAMAEFWRGSSPKKEIRIEGNFYPACQGKCEPILKHMLKGLAVEKNPFLSKNNSLESKITTLYEDEWIVAINKPSGLLSVPGTEGQFSVLEYLQRKYPDATGPILVHRLDMATSGILIGCKNKEVHYHLQRQFAERLVKKRYIALVSKQICEQEGIIQLPLTLDPLDRPRQVVDYVLGKKAITTFKVLEYKKRHTRLALYPHTGRTHQLRVHCAHRDGLGAPIIGDTLYGDRAERLFLHAEQIEFEHPITKQRIIIKAPSPF